MSGHLMNNGLTLDGHTRDLLSRSFKPPRTGLPAGRSGLGAPGQPKQSLPLRLWVRFWRECTPPCTGFAARGAF
jgi:hypothetical protein